MSWKLDEGNPLARSRLSPRNTALVSKAHSLFVIGIIIALDFVNVNHKKDFFEKYLTKII